MNEINRKSAHDTEFPILCSISMQSGPQTKVLHKTNEKYEQL